MSSIKEFKAVLMEGWLSWDRGSEYIPGKDVTLKQGVKGCVLVDEDGATVYSQPMNRVNEGDMADCLLDFSKDFTESSSLNAYLTKEDMKEVTDVFNRYMAYDETL